MQKATSQEADAGITTAENSSSMMPVEPLHSIPQDSKLPMQVPCACKVFACSPACCASDSNTLAQSLAQQSILQYGIEEPKGIQGDIKPFAPL